MVQEPGIDLVLPEGDEIPRLHVAAELVGQEAGIPLADPEGDQVPRIAEDALPDLVGQLIEILMRKDQRKPVFPRLGEDRGERLGREALELVYI